MRVGLIGADRVLGARLLGQLTGRGMTVLASAADVGRLERFLARVSGAGARDSVESTALADGDESAVAAFVGGVDVVVDLRPAEADPTALALRAAIGAERGHLDADPSVTRLRRTLQLAGPEPPVPIVAGARFGMLPGDVLAEIAAREVLRPIEVHVSYLVRDVRSGVPRDVKRTLFDALGEPVTVRVDGATVQERVGESRRLAWFPRPVGPQRALTIASQEPITVAARHPDVRLVRTYLAVPGPLAELMVSADILAARPRMKRLLGPLLLGAEQDPGDVAGARWAVVAEAVGADGLVAHAWAYGSALDELAADGLALLAGRVGGGEVPPGVHGPGGAGDPAPLLDTLASSTDLRWSVRSPHEPS